MTKESWRYDHLTWPEMKAAIARKPQPVVAVPIGAVEDHGPHTPLSTDNDILEGVLAECGRRAGGDLLVLPTIPFGLDEHHMDFPGVIAIDIPTALAYLSQTAVSVARHGFTHLLIVNGHGSNQSICDLAARQCVLATGAICAATTVNAAVSPALVADVLDAERKGGNGYKWTRPSAILASSSSNTSTGIIPSRRRIRGKTGGAGSRRRGFAATPPPPRPSSGSACSR